LIKIQTLCGAWPNHLGQLQEDSPSRLLVGSWATSQGLTGLLAHLLLLLLLGWYLLHWLGWLLLRVPPA
jgi:hypothetical protein